MNSGPKLRCGECGLAVVAVEETDENGAPTWKLIRPCDCDAPVLGRMVAHAHGVADMLIGAGREK